MKSVMADISFSSGTMASMSHKCCAVKPFGTADDPPGKVLRHLIISSGDTCSNLNLTFPVKSHAGLWSDSE